MASGGGSELADSRLDMLRGREENPAERNTGLPKGAGRECLDRVPPYPMSHTTRKKRSLLARVRRLKGQMEAIERALEAEAECAEILNQVASVRGAISGLTAELIEDHL